MNFSTRLQYGALAYINFTQVLRVSCTQIEMIIGILKFFCCLKLMNDVHPMVKPFKNFKHHLATSNGDNHTDIYHD